MFRARPDLFSWDAELGCTPAKVPEFFSGCNEDVKLYSYKDIPHFLKGNPYITDGYRAYLSPTLIAKSLFLWSNESVNIWSHVIGFILFFVLMIYDTFVAVPNFGGGAADVLVLCLAMTSFQVCMFCSAFYHLVHCHSETVCKRWLMFDMTGVSVALLGVYLPGTYYAFYCMQIWRDFYMGIFCIMSLGVLSCQLHKDFLSPRWTSYRVTMYLTLAAYGVIPSLHWIYLSGGFYSSIVQNFIPKVIVMYLLCALAFGFFITYIPERWMPGKLDFVGHSHQWWHIILVVALYWWHNSGIEFGAYMVQQTCQ